MPGRSPSRQRDRALPIVIISAAAFLLLVGGLIAVIVVASTPSAAQSELDRPFYVWPDSAAVDAAAAAEPDSPEFAAATYLAERPASIWLLPEEHGLGDVGPFVASIVEQTSVDGTLPSFVVYGITDRDCGNFSSGGLPPAEYETWVDEIALALGTAPAIVILEPDALGLAPECGDTDARVAEVKRAATALSETSALVYLDGGHSSWLPATEMAELLKDAGVDQTRGFATNVSNYNALADEREYAHELSDLLGGVHAVIDTSRNGSGSNGEWCNPSGRTVGDEPTAIDDDVVDALLWIKTAGESDGECNGGPVAGVWWPERAVELTRDAVGSAE
ncbi:glycoside hydrolase family 6 protein [Agromyces atrinae]|uniref:glycoside hydrolase family 6 protein n=1 Tax=Agromyces atrinae TaxID=592376 RepID=UPI001F56CDB1|nr:glycoside hydrolase family 6 protein [Agromyces atrinae]MCI2957746.1 glycoside hydrolase family 6 protein [Agromyces atrinae]